MCTKRHSKAFLSRWNLSYHRKVRGLKSGCGVPMSLSMSMLLPAECLTYSNSNLKRAVWKTDCNIKNRKFKNILHLFVFFLSPVWEQWKLYNKKAFSRKIRIFLTSEKYARDPHRPTNKLPWTQTPLTARWRQKLPSHNQLPTLGGCGELVLSVWLCVCFHGKWRFHGEFFLFPFPN